MYKNPKIERQDARRNEHIYELSMGGQHSQAYIARVYDLTPGRVSAIIRKHRLKKTRPPLKAIETLEKRELINRTWYQQGFSKEGAELLSKPWITHTYEPIEKEED
tara:strand:+ start:514 stop:831 length:318 start_codon:yes stop_codon:yes gene_type:complete